MTGIILAGGKASRMGGDCNKALLDVGAERIIDRQLKVLRKVFSEIIIVTNTPEHFQDILGTQVVSDILRGKGPLGGLHAGLTASSSSENLVIACDMPFVEEPLMRFIMAQTGFDIMVPKIDGELHPLFGAYSKGCLPVITEQIVQNDLRVHALFAKVKTRFLSREELQGFDSGLKALTNINTPDDLRASRQEV